MVIYLVFVLLKVPACINLLWTIKTKKPLQFNFYFSHLIQFVQYSALAGSRQELGPNISHVSGHVMDRSIFILFHFCFWSPLISGRKYLMACSHIVFVATKCWWEAALEKAQKLAGWVAVSSLERWRDWRGCLQMKLRREKIVTVWAKSWTRVNLDWLLNVCQVAKLSSYCRLVYYICCLAKLCFAFLHFLMFDF